MKYSRYLRRGKRWNLRNVKNASRYFHLLAGRKFVPSVEKRKKINIG
jgi:hypothetical protein